MEALTPFWLVGLHKMLGQYAYEFYKLGRTLDNLWKFAYQRAPTGQDAMDKEFESSLSMELSAVSAKCREMGLYISQLGVDRLIESPPTTYTELTSALPELQRRIEDELMSVYFLHIPPTKITYYQDQSQFGKKVLDKFPKLCEDISEAGKCFATGHYTASVFHLMRTMEQATQYLGKRLGINLLNHKNWNNILDEVDKAIKGLPIKNSRQKVIRNRYAEASIYLRMVKDAWRNEVMHPKETYNEEEAERVFRNVRDFMVHLATKL